MRRGRSRAAPGPGELVTLLGGHPAAALGIDLAGGDAELWRWLAAACLLADRLDESRAASALAALDRAGGSGALALAEADPARIAAALAGAGHPQAERRAAQLVRAAATLAGRHGGSLQRLAEQAADLDELGAALAGLGPGIGAATVRRFLEPLRARFPAAAELPLPPATRAAADHLGLGCDGLDADLGAALARLGARACLRERPDRCPLEASCPLRGTCDGSAGDVG